MTPAEITAMAHEQMPFARVLGLEIRSGDPNRVEATGVWRPEFCTVGGMIHGGYLMATADSVGALCAYLNMAAGSVTSTIESKTNFLRPLSAGKIEFLATPVHKGRTILVVQTDVSDEKGRLVSRTTQTQLTTTPK